jgi:hypothetical protein
MTAAPVRSTEGIAAGELIERSLILDLAWPNETATREERRT